MSLCGRCVTSPSFHLALQMMSSPPLLTFGEEERRRSRRQRRRITNSLLLSGEFQREGGTGAASISNITVRGFQTDRAESGYIGIDCHGRKFEDFRFRLCNELFSLSTDSLKKVVMGFKN